MAVQMGQYNVPAPALPEPQGLPDVRKQNDQNWCRYFYYFQIGIVYSFHRGLLKVRKIGTVQRLNGSNK